MGEAGSKVEGSEGDGAAQHKTPEVDESLSPAQRGFALSHKSEKRNSEFPLFEFTMSGQDFKYMDVRGNHAVAPEDGLLAFEMFWQGELEGLDQKQFVMKATETLAKYGATVGSTLREAGCMISMVACPFTISEENAMALGKAMFADFVPQADTSVAAEK